MIDRASIYFEANSIFQLSFAAVISLCSVMMRRKTAAFFRAYVFIRVLHGTISHIVPTSQDFLSSYYPSFPFSPPFYSPIPLLNRMYDQTELFVCTARVIDVVPIVILEFANSCKLQAVVYNNNDMSVSVCARFLLPHRTTPIRRCPRL